MVSDVLAKNVLGSSGSSKDLDKTGLGGVHNDDTDA